MTSNKKPALPDTDEWVPNAKVSDSIHDSFLKQCISIENLICQRLQFEMEMNVNNFDSGSGFEDIVREEFEKILPKRYSIINGVVIDRDGKTSGDCDIAIFNDLWFPKVKAAATSVSRRCFIPVEGIYAVGEIKLTLSYTTLDEALRKLVTTHRLTRPTTQLKRFAENRTMDCSECGISNPLYSFVLASGIKEGISFQELIDRFFDISRGLKRNELVRALSVLGHGIVVWCYKLPDSGEVKPALFMGEDLGCKLFPGYIPIENDGSALFSLMSNLMLHLYHSILGAEDIVAWYGSKNRTIKVPTSDAHSIDPKYEPVA